MDRNSVLRWLGIAAVVIIVWKFGIPYFTGSNDKPQTLPEEAYVNAPGFVPDVIDPSPDGKPNKPPEGELCTVHAKRLDAVLSSRGASVVHLWLTDAQYAPPGEARYDISTTPDIERWRSLRTLFRSADAHDQLKYDRFDWKVESLGASGCKFTYADDDARIVKTVTATDRPFELAVTTEITNLDDAPKHHQFSIGAFAYRENKELKGSLGRQSPWTTNLECAHDGTVDRKTQSDAKAFKTGPFAVPGADRFVAVNSQYFAQALMPDPGEGGAVTDTPACAILAEEWFANGQTKDSEDAGHVFHARLVYPPKVLAPQASATYHDTAFFGPKERDILAKADGGRPHLGDVINLGFFTPVARVLVGVLNFFHNVCGNWGVSIILMTICLRTLLFPLTWKSIKTSVSMRRLKPEVDALNKKFADDAQAKNLAMMELWKKHGVNPLGGCLPQLVQMPVWFAMYTTLQTAVELYHVKFLWLPDLSSPDQLFHLWGTTHVGPLPILLGGFMILQQRIVPQQGMDATQAKMMMWLMPIIFTVMMLFLPAALGVYMLTNSILGIAQQLAVEKLAPRNGPVPPQPPQSSALVVGKGKKARV